MPLKSLSRRDFLKTTGILLGSAMIVSSGLAALDSGQINESLPEYQ